jgi:hypothetical protein
MHPREQTMSDVASTAASAAPPGAVSRSPCDTHRSSAGMRMIADA